MWKIVWNTLYGKQITDHFRRISITSMQCFKVLDEPSTTVLATGPGGVPLPDEKPEEVNAEIWNDMRKLVSNHTQFQQAVKGPGNKIYIGGMLEACLANAAAYHANYCETQKQQIFYIPELCPFYYEEKIQKAHDKLQEIGVKKITFEEALALIE